jgi:hypothetical protein
MERKHVVVLVLATLGMLTAAPAAGPVRLKGDPKLYAIDPRTGSVLAVDAQANTAALYPAAYIDGKSDEFVGPVRIAAGARRVIFKPYKKKAWFLISFEKGASIAMLDARTLKPAGKLHAPKPITSITAGSDAEDPFVYASYGWSAAGSCFHVGSGERVGDLPVEGSEIVASASGEYVYARSLGVSPTGFDCYRRRIDAQTGVPQWTKVFDKHDDAGQYVPDPFGRYCTVGSQVRTSDLAEQVAKLDFVPDCFLRTRPAMVGVTPNGRLRAASYNTFKTFATLDLPAGMAPQPQRDHWRPRFDPPPLVCLSDNANERVVVAGRAQLLPLTMKQLKIPDEPVLVCEVTGPDRLTVGRAASLTVKPLDRSCRIRLKDGPKGAQYDDGALTWTPQEGQVGPVEVVLELSGGNVKVDQTVKLNVVRPLVELPMSPGGFAVSSDATRAFVWEGNAKEHHQHGDRRATEIAKVCLVDLEKMALVATKTLPYAIRTAAVDEHFVYVSPAGADRINALKLKDLARQTFAVAPSAVTRLLPAGGKKIAAITANHGLRVFSVPKLEKADLPTDTGPEWGHHPYAHVNMRMNRDGQGAIRAIGDNWYTSGCLFDPTLTSARMLVNVTGLPTIEDDQRLAPVEPLPWGRLLTHRGLTTRTDQQIAQLPHDGQTALLTDVPVAATLLVKDKQIHRNWHEGRIGVNRSAMLCLRELVGGKVVIEAPLMSEPAAEGERARNNSWGHPGGLVGGAGRTVLAVVGKQLFVHRLDEAALKGFPPPFNFEPLAKPPVLETAKPSVIQVRTVGGAGPVEYELLGSSKHVKIDTKTGAVTVDGPALLAEALKALGEELPPSLRITRGHNPRRYYPPARSGGSAELTPRQAVAQIARRYRTRYKAFTGKMPEGIPVLIPIRVAATDKHQQVANMQFQAVLVVPQNHLQKVVDKAVATAAKRRAEEEKARAEAEKRYREEMARRRQQYERVHRATSQPAESESVRKLEERVRRLEAQVELLTKLLMEKREP